MAIYKFLNVKEVEKMSIEELFQYKQFLEQYKKHMREDVQNLKANSQFVREELEIRHARLQKLYDEAEHNRLNCDVYLHHILTFLH